MSILPTQNLGSTSSSSSQSPSHNPNSNHGIALLQQPHPHPSLSSPTSLSHQTQALQSLRISNSASPLSMYADVSGSVAPTTEYSGGSSKKMNEVEKVNGKKILSHQSNGKNSQSDAATVEESAGSIQNSGELSETIVSPQTQLTSESINSHGSTTHTAGRRNQMVNGNHLLNFRYDPISRPLPRAPPPRRQQKRRPYNKDLFLQANYKFVVLNSGNYSPELMDPDKMLQWEDVICVKYSTPFPVQCPICLEDPLCPQITSCGHIFCFPCILQYFSLGERDHKGECWKKCPLCFMMISSKDLYTIYIENVIQHCVGDNIEFMLLTRQKDSYTVSMKNKLEVDTDKEVYDSFSKFVFTSDVEMSVRKAILDLDTWLVRADSGLVDDLEKLPYVCAAMEQLEQRKKYWNEHGLLTASKACKFGASRTRSQERAASANTAHANLDLRDLVWGSLSTDLSNSKSLGDSVSDKLDGEASLCPPADVFESSEDQVVIDETRNVLRHDGGLRGHKEKDSYSFYQAVDGQHLILHPLNMKCLLHHYGSYNLLPHRISGKIVQLETVTQSEGLRRRYRYLSHFSLTTTFQLCEIDLSDVLPLDALSPYIDEIKNREQQRKRLARKEHQEKLKAEAAASHFVPITFNFAQSSHEDPPSFSIDDFEALGSSVVTSSSPPIVGDRKLFSSVARLGFAAGHDSPSLKTEQASSPPKSGARIDSGATGMRNTGTPSFANVISRAKPVGVDTSGTSEMGKKGKKSSRVLLSTAGGRRY